MGILRYLCIWSLSGLYIMQEPSSYIKWGYECDLLNRMTCWVDLLVPSYKDKSISFFGTWRHVKICECVFMVFFHGPTFMVWFFFKSIYKAFGAFTRCKLNVDQDERQCTKKWMCWFFFNISKNASFESLTIILSSLVFTSLHFSYPHVFVCIHLKFHQTLLQWRRGLILLLNLYMLWTSKIWILQGEWEEFAILSLVYASIGALIDEHMESRTNIQFIDHLLLGSWTMKKFRNQLEWNILYLNVCVRGSFGRKKMISILR